jgi:hypothetical protein
MSKTTEPSETLDLETRVGQLEQQIAELLNENEDASWTIPTWIDAHYHAVVAERANVAKATVALAATPGSVGKARVRGRIRDAVESLVKEGVFEEPVAFDPDRPLHVQAAHLRQQIKAASFGEHDTLAAEIKRSYASDPTAGTSAERAAVNAILARHKYSRYLTLDQLDAELAEERDLAKRAAEIAEHNELWWAERAKEPMQDRKVVVGDALDRAAARAAGRR